jgi:MFS family permease
MTTAASAQSAPSRVQTALPRARYALGVLTFINLLNYLDRYIVSGVIPRIEETFGIDHAQAGWLQTVFILVYMLVAPLGGYLGDRYPRRWVLSLSIFIWSFATFGAGLAGTFAVLLVTRAIVGVGEAGYGTVSPGLIADLLPVQRAHPGTVEFYVAIARWGGTGPAWRAGGSATPGPGTGRSSSEASPACWQRASPCGCTSLPGEPPRRAERPRQRRCRSGSG